MNFNRKSFSFLILAGCFFMIGSGELTATNPPATDGHAPVKTVFDTDMCDDCDDCGALAVLHKLADLGEAEILACVVNSHDQEKAVAASVSAINTYYGRPGIPIGTYHGPDGKTMKSRYTAELRDKFAHYALPDDQQPTALSVYRTALASAQDSSVTIISVGLLVNLRDLLQSEPDATSPLSGRDLVKAKVKRLVVMGGAFPKSDPVDGEFNFSFTANSTQYVMANWPTPILLSGVELAGGMITGKSLDSTPETNPIRRAYALAYDNCIVHGRPSWDLTAVLAAVRDPHIYWDVSPNGRCKVSSIGTNKWEPSPDLGHTYLIKKAPSQGFITDLLNRFLISPPGSTDCQ